LAGVHVIEGGCGAVPVVKVHTVVRPVHGVGPVLVANIDETPGAHGVEILSGGGSEDVVHHELRRVHQVIVV